VTHTIKIPGKLLMKWIIQDNSSGFSEAEQICRREEVGKG